MIDEPRLPRRLILLGDELRPFLQKFKKKINAPVALETTSPPIADLLTAHMSRLSIAMKNIEATFAELMETFISNESANDREAYRAARRLEAIPDELLKGYYDIQRVISWGEDKQARDLMCGIYRHSLLEIYNWLEKLVETLQNPLAEMRRRGLSNKSSVELKITLTLTSAPQMAELQAWCDRKAASYLPVIPPPEPDYPEISLGFWAKAGLLVIGWYIFS